MLFRKPPSGGFFLKNLKYNMKKIIFKLTFLILLGFCSLSFSQRSDNSIVAVNGSKITSAQLDQWLSVAISEGKKDTPELRQAILNDLVVREAIAQDIKKTNLLSKGNNAFKVRVAEQNAAMDLWFSQYLAAHPVSEAEVRATYDKQVAESKEPKNSKEYQISQIVVPDEVEANKVLVQLKSGSSFEALAKEVSVDQATSQRGGLLGWVLLQQLASPLNDLVPTISKGAVASKPVQVGSAWIIVKVDDIKPFIMPSFDQAKVSIAQSLIQQRRQDAIRALMQNAKVTK
ncbi:peptidyl-prolyl cis-trans isomerase C [Polynucleobacter sphagniphilus]|uniref:foldase protein PrsA n=1 Tax=Polynucleobacter sphagniphilus TaxID=1743169 RepID=UPI002476BA83|nr:peptidyl-prolyl cis-trans isomerase [Polynucleobacter sphagniphilus]MDH6249536.1 peptidyl-prolyl cis-trans isomerase C [Polynucleobacter sphagniphilus]